MTIKKQEEPQDVAPSLVPTPLLVESLHFDRKNPRLQELTLPTANATDDEILDALWKQMAVDEVALSIAANGFFDHEPIYVANEGGEMVVLEGNRRLAAVKLLLSADLRKKVGATDLPELSKAEREKLNTLPAIVTDRKALWSFIGFKHINGAQPWGAYSKAHYIAWVKNELGHTLDDIAREIGDQHATVSRHYDGLMVLKQAEDMGVFDREDRWKKHFSFSHLFTALTYPACRKFLRISPTSGPIGKTRPVPAGSKEQLGWLLKWLFGSKKENLPPVVESQNPDLKKLIDALGQDAGIRALKKGLPLDLSLDIARGDSETFNEALFSAKQALQKAQATVVTGFTGAADQMGVARDASKLAGALLEQMHRIQAELPRGKARPET